MSGEKLTNEMLLCRPYLEQPLADGNGVPIALTAPMAAEMLKRDCPAVGQWMCWYTERDPAEDALRTFIGNGMHNQGRVGGWTWERVPCFYNGTAFWDGQLKNRKYGVGWGGLLRIKGAKGEEFLMFSYIRPDTETNKEYLVSTGDVRMLRRFARDVERHMRPRRSSRHLRVRVMGGADIEIRADMMEEVYLPQDLKDDIMGQVDTFFRNRDFYRRLGVPYRRGFLFTGLPGTGKTLMIRKLIRHCYREFGTRCGVLEISQYIPLENVETFFNVGESRRPILMVLEDVESLTQGTNVTRSQLLAHLDGLDQRGGALILATANRPELIDSALVHRPSRFDRVWRFPLPDKNLRREYLRRHLEELTPELV